jgi:hypothetical protein
MRLHVIHPHNPLAVRTIVRNAAATLGALVLACSAPALFAQGTAGGKAAPTASAPNTLTDAERAAGWKLLFDGKTNEGWRSFHGDTFPAQGWSIEDGTIRRVPRKEGQPAGGGGGDIITTGRYENFELALDWKLSPGGNSGLKYLIAEQPDRRGRSGVGYEMQILDDERHPDAKAGVNGNRTAGALYDLIAPSAKAAHPPGEWNQARLVVQGRHVEHWLNGKRIVQFEIGSPEMKALIAKSKYKDIKGFGESTSGHILLQDHGDDVSFRNLKIRALSAGATKH